MSRDSRELTELELEVVSLSLEAAGVGADRVRRGLDQLRVQSRTSSGVGFVTKFERTARDGATAGREALPEPPAILGAHPDLPSGAEFVLQIKGGSINSLEAFSYEGYWPGDEDRFRFVTKRDTAMKTKEGK